MATTVVFNGSNYSVPAFGDTGWAQGTGNLSSYLIALASGTLQTTGGSFTLSAPLNFGPTFGITAASFTGPLTGNITGNITGNVSGNITGNVTGNVTGSLTGNVTGNVSGSSGSCTGNAATATLASNVTTNANLTGDVTSVGNATTLAHIPAISGANLTNLTAANISSGTAAISISGTAADANASAGSFSVGANLGVVGSFSTDNNNIHTNGLGSISIAGNISSVQGVTATNVITSGLTVNGAGNLGSGGSFDSLGDMTVPQLSTPSLIMTTTPTTGYVLTAINSGGQMSWQAGYRGPSNVTSPSRSFSTPYQNTTGFTMWVTITVTNSLTTDNSTATFFTGSTSGLSGPQYYIGIPPFHSATDGSSCTFVIPNNWFYQLNPSTGAVNLQTWTETY